MKKQDILNVLLFVFIDTQFEEQKIDDQKYGN